MSYNIFYIPIIQKKEKAKLGEFMVLWKGHGMVELKHIHTG